jgi:hypothetical protein
MQTPGSARAHAAHSKCALGAEFGAACPHVLRTPHQLRGRALQRAGQMHSNKAAVALLNKLARIAWAAWHHERNFDGNHAVRAAA